MRTAVETGEFAKYFANLNDWLSHNTPGDAAGIADAVMIRLLKDGAFHNALAQRQFLVKHGVDKVGGFAKAAASPQSC